jgi:hypothetical protein
MNTHTIPIEPGTLLSIKMGMENAGALITSDLTTDLARLMTILENYCTSPRGEVDPCDIQVTSVVLNSTLPATGVIEIDFGEVAYLGCKDADIQDGHSVSIEFSVDEYHSCLILDVQERVNEDDFHQS